MKRQVFWIAVLIMALAGGCSGYNYKPVPFKAAEAYPNHTVVFGAVVAARAWTSEAEAEDAFGFNIRGAGLTPVQIVVDNRGGDTLELMPDQTLLLDKENQYWNLLPAQVAYDRIDHNAAAGRMIGKGAEKGFLGGLAGGILGAAFGVVTGTNVGEAAMRGAAAGAALGAVMGGAEGLDDPQARQMIANDLKSRSLSGKPLAPYQISHGFLFFPGEIEDAHSLRLKLKSAQEGQITIVDLNLVERE